MLQLFLANKDVSEHILTLKLAKLATDLNLSDWDANTQAAALETIKQYKMTAEEFLEFRELANFTKLTEICDLFPNFFQVRGNDISIHEQICELGNHLSIF